jgi:hypothetical protein
VIHEKIIVWDDEGEKSKYSSEQSVPVTIPPPPPQPHKKKGNSYGVPRGGTRASK